MAQAREALDRHFAAVDGGDIDGLARIWAPDGELVNPMGSFSGREQLQAFFGMLVPAFPDQRHEIVDAVELGDTVAIEGRFSGTHTGVLSGPTGDIAPTGRSVELRFAGFARATDGQIRSLHTYFDQVAFLTQLGLMPEPTTV